MDQASNLWCGRVDNYLILHSKDFKGNMLVTGVEDGLTWVKAEKRLSTNQPAVGT